MEVRAWDTMARFHSRTMWPASEARETRSALSAWFWRAEAAIGLVARMRLTPSSCTTSRQGLTATRKAAGWDVMAGRALLLPPLSKSS